MEVITPYFSEIVIDLVEVNMVLVKFVIIVSFKGRVTYELMFDRTSILSMSLR